MSDTPHLTTSEINDKLDQISDKFVVLQTNMTREQTDFINDIENLSQKRDKKTEAEINYYACGQCAGDRRNFKLAELAYEEALFEFQSKYLSKVK